MDTLTLETLIDINIIINNQSKWDFLSHVSARFNFLKQSGTTRLKEKIEICMIYNQGCPVYAFETNEKIKGKRSILTLINNILKDIAIRDSEIG